MVTISKRTLVRIFSFSLAGIFLLSGVVLQGRTAMMDYRVQLESFYARSLGELSSYLTNIATDLDKGQYIGTPAQLSLLSARIWRESGGAKSALSALPVSELHMDATYKFLSQVGDYAMTLSKKVASGQTLSDDEKKNAEALRQYAGKLREYVDSVQERITGGQIDITAMRTAGQGDSTQGTQASGRGLSDGFEKIEQTMTGYPTLIYDGPFSDHLLSQRPRLTAGQPVVTAEQALDQAARAARVNTADLRQADDENSNMPSYTFGGNNLSVGVTKSGGFVTYLINARDVGEQRISYAAAYKNAERYLASLGIVEMRATYFETADGICTINYAATLGETTLYTDLIKVGVAMDDGSIVFYDARGYISNHHARELPAPALTPEQAAKSVNPSLRIESRRLALIPTSGKGEVLTYEFKVKTNDGQHLLVYVNTATGAEEQILILIETSDGTLTK